MKEVIIGQNDSDWMMGGKSKTSWREEGDKNVKRETENERERFLEE